MTSSPPVLLCFDGSGGALRAIQDAGRLLGPRTAVVLTVWEAARDLTTLDPVGDVVPPPGDQSGGTAPPSNAPRTE